MRRWRRIAPVLLVLLLSFFYGCSKKITGIVDGGRWRAPETELTYAPLDSDTASFRVHLYWYGYDRDGQVIAFRFAVDSDTSKPLMLWHRTTAKDSIFTFTVRPGDLVGGHVFWVSAQDDQGYLDRTPAKRYFSIRTVPPTSEITGGPMSGALTSSNVAFSWKGTDPDGGPTGNPVPADSFEYMLLRPGTSFDGSHTPLPGVYSIDPNSNPLQGYLDLLNAASGASLPAPYDDWKWTGTSTTSQPFAGLEQGQYVFAIRAVDAAGAHDVRLKSSQNVRFYTVVSSPDRQSPPLMTIRSDVMSSAWTNVYDPHFYEYLHAPIPILDGEPVTFSWTGAPGSAGYPLAGFTSALEDTTTESWSHPDLTQLAITLPADLQPGRHVLYVRLLDTSGASAIAVLNIDVVHAAFRDPAQPPSMLYVDDFAPPPGDWNTAVLGSPNFPADQAEDDWWTRVILAPLARDHGMTFEQWDAVYGSVTSPDGTRTPPPLEELAKHRVVIWSVDLNNTLGLPTGLWRTLQGGASELRTYVRAGGTVILTGFILSRNVGGNTVGGFYLSTGVCSTMTPATSGWDHLYFLRDFMGIDAVKANDEAARYLGARDFVAARLTPDGTRLGFQAADVDSGAAGTGAKWNPYAFAGSPAPDFTLAPGLPKVEGWRLETALGCNASESAYRRENPALAIASPLFTYHGVNEGVLQDGSPSPREGLVVGVATQAHDDGNGDGSVITPGNAHGVTGRMVFLGFPVYYIKDAQAYEVMRAALAYVNGSPTLPAGTP